MGCGDDVGFGFLGGGSSGANSITDSLGITQHGANKAYKKQQNSLSGLFAQLQGSQNLLFGQAHQQGKKGLAALNMGYQGALDSLAHAGMNSKQGVLDREKQTMGGLSQSMTNRGLFNTTAYDNARRGITSDTNTALSSIDEQLAALEGGIKQERGQAQAGQYNWLANLFQNQAGANTNLGLAQGQMMFGAPYNSSSLAPGGAGKIAEMFAFM